MATPTPPTQTSGHKASVTLFSGNVRMVVAGSSISCTVTLKVPLPLTRLDSSAKASIALAIGEIIAKQNRLSSSAEVVVQRLNLDNRPDSEFCRRVVLVLHGDITSRNLQLLSTAGKQIRQLLQDENSNLIHRNHDRLDRLLS